MKNQKIFRTDSSRRAVPLLSSLGVKTFQYFYTLHLKVNGSDFIKNLYTTIGLNKIVQTSTPNASGCSNDLSKNQIFNVIGGNIFQIFYTLHLNVKMFI